MDRIDGSGSKDTDINRTHSERKYREAPSRDAEHFKKRPGTTDLGKEYENQMVAYLALKLALDDKIKDFTISSNDERFGDFDDVVIDMTTTEGAIEKIALQLKHSANNKNWILDGFRGEKGDYSIKKYFKAYQQVKDVAQEYKLMLFTNNKFNVTESKSTFELKDQADDVSMELKISRVQENFRSFTDLRDSCFKFDMISCGGNESTSNEYKTFLNQFLLCSNQKRLAAVEEDTAKLYESKISSDCRDYKDYVHFINRWSRRDGKKEFLNKALIKETITLQVLTPFIKPVMPCSDVSHQLLDPLKELIEQFDVVVVGKNCCADIQQLWGAPTNRCSVEIANRYQFTQDTTTEAKILWILRTHPLIVEGNQTTYRIINFYNDGKFVVVGDEFSKRQIQNLTVFEKLSDISESVKNVTKNFKVTVQGKENVSLQALIECHPEVVEMITMNELILMAKNSFQIGEDKEALPEAHTGRLLSRNIIDFRFLKERSKDTLTVISCCGRFDLIREKTNNFNIIDVEDYLYPKTTFNGKAGREMDLYVAKRECSLDAFKKIAHHVQVAHLLTVTEEGTLEWIHTKGKVAVLENFKAKSQSFMCQQELLCCRSGKTNLLDIVVGEPGMGKSTLLKSLKNNYSEMYWKIMISPKDHFDFLQNLKDGNFEEVTDCGTFENSFIKILKAKSHVVFFWDGLDEISKEDLELTVDVVKKLSERGFRQFVAARSHMATLLEQKFNALSIRILPFDDHQQRNYIQQRLNHANQDTIEKIFNYVQLVRYNEIVGVPLQISMLVDLFERDPEKYLEQTGLFSISELYRYSVDEKLNIYMEKKGIRDPTNYHKKSMCENIERVALILFLNKDVLGTLYIDCDSFLEHVKNENYANGIIVGVTDHEKPKYLHQSYGEYFAATYFVKYHARIPEFEKFIFDEKNSNIRFMFDLILAQESTAHLAVLYKNFDILQNNEGSVNSKDALGRTPLHLACSWGERHPLLDSENVEGSFIVDETKGHYVKEDSEPYKNIVEFLIKKCINFSEKDHLFKADACTYADKALCLYPIALFAKYHNVQIKDCDVPSVLFYSTKFRFIELFKSIEELVFIKTTSGKTLLHVAAEYDNVQIMKELLTNDFYKKCIDEADEFDEKAIHIASRKGSMEVVETLKEGGADVNAAQKDGTTSVHVASLNGHLDVVKILQENGASVNVADQHGFTPIYYASLNGHLDVVKTLEKSGADVNAANENGDTPIRVASQNGHHDVVKILKESGADVNRASNNGFTPIYIASQEGHLDVVKLLKESGADVNAANENGWTPIHMASQNNHLGVVKLLETSGANVNAANMDGFTPIYVASQNGHHDVVKFLTNSGADVNAANKNGWTPIHIAAQNGQHDVVELLKESGADVNAATKDGWTPIYIASRQGYFELVKLLIDSDAKVNFANNHGNTPIHAASGKGYLNVVRLLLDHGADIHTTDIDGDTPLHDACSGCHLDVVRLLLLFSCQDDLDILNSEGKTPVDLATGKKHSAAVVDLLRSWNFSTTHL